MQPAPLRSLARLGLTVLLTPTLLGTGQAAAPGPLLTQATQSRTVPAAVPAAPATAADAPAQQLFDEVNALIQGRYGGLSTVDRRALAREYQQRLNAVCAPQPRDCPEDKAYPVLEAELTALGDEHSFFQTPEDYRDFVTSATGGSRQQFGVKLAKLDSENRLVLEVVPQGAAETAGLRRGDVLRTLDGAPYRYTDLQSARREGRAIRLGVDRQGQSLELTLQARESSTRDLPRLSFVGSQMNVALIRIPTFLTGGGVAQRVHDLVREAQGAGARGMIVDLRGNTGGSLSECDSAVSAFVPSFTRVAQSADGQSQTTVQRGRRLEDGQLRGGVRNPQLWSGPLAVLVNEISASCSEFFAYEVQFARRGPVIGEQTAGVGNTATRVFPVGEQAALQLTLTHYVKPGGQAYPVRVTPDQPAPEGEAELRLLSQGDDVLLRAGLAALATAPTLAADGKRP